MRQPSVSVVMPVYNAAKFIHKSLDSLLNQTLQNIEIICVNDGSTDDSLAILKDYASRDARIKIIDKPNSGYGHTINRGIEAASGEYIGNLDPDDFTDIGMYEKLYHTAKEYDADVVKSNYYAYRSKNGESIFFEVLSGLPYNQITSADENERIFHRQPCIWSAIYKKELLINNHIFLNETPGASYQDTAFAFKVWVNAKKVVFIKDAFVHYRTDNESSSVHDSDKVFYVCDEFNSIQSYLNQDEKLRNKFSKILQVLKYDTYVWNLNRISDTYKEVFRDQIALEFIKAEYDGLLDKAYFDEGRWNGVQKYIHDYHSAHISANNGRTLLKIAMKKLKHKILG